MQYCHSPYLYQRRKTREVVVGDPTNGGVIIGGDHPVVDAIDAHLRHDGHRGMREANAGFGRGRLPDRAHHRADGERRGESEEHRRRTARARLHRADCRGHSFQTRRRHGSGEVGRRWSASIPAITPIQKNLPIKEYTDDQYDAELERIEEKFTPLVKLCKQLGRAMRIGTNHGSLSDRIMNRYGDTPLGMVESALEFARIARKNDYHNFKFSMKSSNPKVMIECYRLLVARLDGTRAGLELSDSPRRHRSRRRRRWPHQERHRHRLAALRRPGRHHSRFADGRFAARNRRLPRFARADSDAHESGRCRSCRKSNCPFDPFTFKRRANAGNRT